MKIYDVGDRVRFSVAFKDEEGADADPTTITFKLRSPTRVFYTHTYPDDITKDNTGQYHLDFTLTGPGEWCYRFEGTGAVETAAEGTLKASASNFY
jgi:uncharacterized protein YfaS (alpha-2-macroglobulin family)